MAISNELCQTYLDKWLSAEPVTQEPKCCIIDNIAFYEKPFRIDWGEWLDIHPERFALYLSSTSDDASDIMDIVAYAQDTEVNGKILSLAGNKLLKNDVFAFTVGESGGLGIIW